MKCIPAKYEDIDWIMALENAPENREFIWQGSQEEHRLEIADPHTDLFIHENDEGLKVGYSLNRYHLRTKNFEIRRIVISEKGQGYGRRVMESLLAFGFLHRGAQRIWLDVYPHNQIGISLYRSLGFKQEAHLRRSDYQRGQYYDQLIFGLLREEYTQKE